MALPHPLHEHVHEHLHERVVEGVDARASGECATTSARSPFAPANTLVAAYLAATTLPLVAGAARGSTNASTLATHVAMLAVTAWAARRRAPAASTARDAIAAWAPLLLIPPMYAELPALSAALGRTLHDALVIRGELALFGGTSPARTFAAHAPWAPLSETLHAGYLSYYAVIFGPPLALFLARRGDRKRAFGACAFTVMLAFVCCFAAFALFPVQGPWFEWPAPAAIPRGVVRLAVERLLHAGSSRGTAFPSSHVAVSVAQTLVSLELQPRVGAACAVCTVALALGAVYGGLHYGIDVVAGALLGAVIGVAGPRLFRRYVPA